MKDNTKHKDKVLSISVAAYNTEKTLRRTISSVLTNCDILDDIEIIIINDGSSDATSKIAHEYESSYPDTVVVIDKKNGGYGSTINSSLQIARGKYYKLLDGDDWFDSDYLKPFIEFLSRSDADMVINPYYEVREEKRKIDNHLEIPAKETSLAHIRICNLFFVMHEITIKTERLRNSNHLITEHCFYTDTEYNFVCFLCTETIIRFDHAIYCYRIGVNGQSMSLAGIRKHYLDMIHVSKVIIGLFQDNKRSFGETRLLIQESYVKHVILYVTYGLLALQNRKQSRKELQDYEYMLKEVYPEEYRISSQRKFLRIGRLLHYIPYQLFRGYALKKYV